MLDLSPAKDDVLQLSRLRAAWREGSLLLEKARKRRLEGVLEDADEPLDAQTHDDWVSQWKSTYQLQLSSHAMPSDTLLGRSIESFNAVRQHSSPPSECRACSAALCCRERKMST